MKKTTEETPGISDLKSDKEQSFEEILGIAHLPHDTCQKCRKVFSDAEVNRYGKNNPALCEECQKNENR